MKNVGHPYVSSRIGERATTCRPLPRPHPPSRVHVLCAPCREGVV